MPEPSPSLPEFAGGSFTEGSVAYQGEAGANSFAACRDILPGLDPVGFQTFEEVFGAVEAGDARFGLIPIENSIAGRVADIHHLLPDSGLRIIGEHFLPIHFHLMALPGSTIDRIARVRSHIHALGQCRRVIRAHRWVTEVANDTAGAAREVAELGDPTVGALSPLAAADLYGLDVLAHEVEDEHGNTTRFLVLSRDAYEPPPGGGPTITTFCFRVRNIPAALYKAMGGFATNGVNMTKLESYQLEGSFSATQFYADIEGHPQEPRTARALEELRYFSTQLRLLGTYPAHPYRLGVTPDAEHGTPAPTGQALVEAPPRISRPG